MAKTRVTRVQTHQPIFGTGWGTIGNTLPASGKSFKNLRMHTRAEGVEASHTPVGSRAELTILIPWGNICSCDLGDELIAVPAEENKVSQAV